MIYSGLRGGLEYVSVTRDGKQGRNDATYLMAYFPQDAKITFKTERIAGKTLRGWWFNPCDGSVQTLGEFANQPKMEFTPPTHSDKDDWILVLDGASKIIQHPESQSNRLATGNKGNAHRTCNTTIWLFQAAGGFISCAPGLIAPAEMR